MFGHFSTLYIKWSIRSRFYQMKSLIVIRSLNMLSRVGYGVFVSYFEYVYAFMVNTFAFLYNNVNERNNYFTFVDN